MSSVLAHGTLTRQLPCSQHPSRCTRNELFVQSNCRRPVRCRQYTCRRVRAGGAFGRLSAEDWRDFAPVGLVARRLLVNVSALFFLVLAESVPLCCADASVLPKASLQLLNATSVASHGALQLLHPFILGVVPFVEAMIFIQMLGGTVGWDKLPVPPRFKLSRTEMQTPYGVAAIKFLSAVLGAVIAAGFATVGANILISTGAVGHGQRLDIIVSLVAGSAIVYKLSELITEFGLGQGISFIYMVSIASSASITFCCCCALSDREAHIPRQCSIRAYSPNLWHMQGCRIAGQLHSRACLVPRSHFAWVSQPA